MADMLVTEDQLIEEIAASGLSVPASWNDGARNRAIERSTQQIQQWCGRRFIAGEDDEARTYSGNGLVALWIDDALSITSITLDGSELSSGLWHACPANATPITHVERHRTRMYPLARGYDLPTGYVGRATWTLGQQNVVIAGQFGYSDPLPGSIEDACCLLAIARLARVYEFPTIVDGTVKQGTVLGVTFQLDQRDSTIKAISETARALVQPYVRVYSIR